MARRLKGNYEAYINQVSPVIALQDKIKNKENKKVTTDTITMSNGRIRYERKAAGKLILKHICMKTINSYYKKTP